MPRTQGSKDKGPRTPTRNDIQKAEEHRGTTEAGGEEPLPLPVSQGTAGSTERTTAGFSSFVATQEQVSRFLAGRTGGTLAGGADSPDHQSETRDDGAVGTADQNGTERETGEHADHEDARPADAVGAAADGHIHRTIMMGEAPPLEPDRLSEPTIGHELPHAATEAEEKVPTVEDMRMSDDAIGESGKLPPVVLPRSLCLTHSLFRPLQITKVGNSHLRM